MTIVQISRWGLAAIAAYMAPASQAYPAAQVSDLSWLAGHWLECSARGEAAETWTDDRGGVMLGLSKSIRNGRTSWELSRIDRTSEGILFFASPKGQQAPLSRQCRSRPTRQCSKSSITTSPSVSFTCAAATG